MATIVIILYLAGLSVNLYVYNYQRVTLLFARLLIKMPDTIYAFNLSGAPETERSDVHTVQLLLTPTWIGILKTGQMVLQYGLYIVIFWLFGFMWGLCSFIIVQLATSFIRVPPKHYERILAKFLLNETKRTKNMIQFSQFMLWSDLVPGFFEKHINNRNY